MIFCAAWAVSSAPFFAWVASKTIWVTAMSSAMYGFPFRAGPVDERLAPFRNRAVVIGQAGSVWNNPHRSQNRRRPAAGWRMLAAHDDEFREAPDPERHNRVAGGLAD